MRLPRYARKDIMDEFIRASLVSIPCFSVANDLFKIRFPWVSATRVCPHSPAGNKKPGGAGFFA